MRRASAIMSLLLLAGCSTPVAEPPTDPIHDKGWKDGDWWAYTSDLGAFTIVARDHGSFWRLEPDKEWLASLESAHDLPWLGVFVDGWNEDYSPIQVIAHDMEKGDIWETSHYFPFRHPDLTMPLVATVLESRDNAFEVSMVSSDGPHYRYTYSPSIGWMQEMTAEVPSQWARSWELFWTEFDATLVAHGTDFEGTTYHYARGETKIGSGSLGYLDVGSEEEIWAYVRADCGAPALMSVILVFQGAGQPGQFNEPCMGEMTMQVSHAAQAGRWWYEIGWGSVHQLADQSEGTTWFFMPRTLEPTTS